MYGFVRMSFILHFILFYFFYIMDTSLTLSTFWGVKCEIRDAIIGFWVSQPFLFLFFIFDFNDISNQSIMKCKRRLQEAMQSTKMTLVKDVKCNFCCCRLCLGLVVEGKIFGWNPQQPNWPKDWTMLGYLED